jgi:hypothetical protein
LSYNLFFDGLFMNEDGPHGQDDDAVIVELGGSPNGAFDERQGGPYCPMGPLEEVAKGVHPHIEARFFNWLDALRKAGLLKGKLRPGYALWEVFYRYQNDPSFKRCILNATKEEILIARERAPILYLAGHSLGAAIACEALKELIEERRITPDEHRYLYLILLSPAVGPVMRGRFKANMSTQELASLNPVVDGAMELRVKGDDLSADTPWVGSDTEQGIIRHHIHIPFHVLGTWCDRFLSLLGHTFAPWWGQARLASQVQAWAIARKRSAGELIHVDFGVSV